QRRLARAVLAQDRDRLAPLDRERDPVERGDAAHPWPGVPAADAAPELLAQLADLDRGEGRGGWAQHGGLEWLGHEGLLEGNTETEDSVGCAGMAGRLRRRPVAQHRGQECQP